MIGQLDADRSAPDERALWPDLTEVHQKLHNIVAEAAWLSNARSCCRSCFWSEFSHPGQLWDIRQTHVSDVNWKASSQAAHDLFERSPAMKAWYDERDNAFQRVLSTTGYSHSKEEWTTVKYLAEHPKPRDSVQRAAKVQIAMWPFMDRHFPRHQNTANGGSYNTGEYVHTVQKAQVVYYAGVDGDAGDHAEDYTLSQHLSDWRARNVSYLTRFRRACLGLFPRWLRKLLFWCGLAFLLYAVVLRAQGRLRKLIREYNELLFSTPDEYKWEEMLDEQQCTCIECRGKVPIPSRPAITINLPSNDRLTRGPRGVGIPGVVSVVHKDESFVMATPEADASNGIPVAQKPAVPVDSQTRVHPLPDHLANGGSETLHPIDKEEHHTGSGRVQTFTSRIVSALGGWKWPISWDMEPSWSYDAAFEDGGLSDMMVYLAGTSFATDTVHAQRWLDFAEAMAQDLGDQVASEAMADISELIRTPPATQRETDALRKKLEVPLHFWDGYREREDVRSRVAGGGEPEIATQSAKTSQTPHTLSSKMGDGPRIPDLTSAADAAQPEDAPETIAETQTADVPSTEASPLLSSSSSSSSAKWQALKDRFWIVDPSKKSMETPTTATTVTRATWATRAATATTTTTTAKSTKTHMSGDSARDSHEASEGSGKAEEDEETTLSTVTVVTTVFGVPYDCTIVGNEATCAHTVSAETVSTSGQVFVAVDGTLVPVQD